MEELELITKAKNGDTFACNQVIKQYENLIESKVNARGYHYYSYDYQELLQCGRLAVYKSILSFDNKKRVKFATFVSRVIDNELINYLRQLNTQKQKANLNTLPINNQGEMEITNHDGETTFVPFESDLKSPENEIIDNETLTYALHEVGLKLSDMEFDILKLQLQGLKQKEIADILHIPVKSVENALTRIRTKIPI
ncbi:MAG: sigma-70 family RNA polymerase sigma factor [Clostridia bacterium]|nr:sigma-70 family RNA polymerase sigma factor [Clostridia bacterium]